MTMITNKIHGKQPVQPDSPTEPGNTLGNMDIISSYPVVRKYQTRNGIIYLKNTYPAAAIKSIERIVKNVS